MPELPEVETVTRGLAGRLPGRTLRRAELLRDDIMPAGRDRLPELIGCMVACVRRRGKNVLIGFDVPLWLRVNLGMTGRLYFAGAGEAPVHTHLRLHFDGDAPAEVHFRDPRRFGGVWLLAGEDPCVHEGLSELGPEPLEIGLAEFRARLQRRRPVKTALLDQHMLAGVGNIYADESLFLAGIHPLRQCDDLDAAEARRLWSAIRKVLNKAIKCGGSTIRDYISSDGAEGWFQLHHSVYGREGEPCRKCRTSVERIVLTARSSHFCPTCQPAR